MPLTFSSGLMSAVERNARSASAPIAVRRDASWIAREYGAQKWPTTLREVERELARGETDLARVHGRVTRQEYLQGEDSMTTQDVVIDARVLRAPIGLVWGAYRELVIDLVLDCCDEATDLVLELGAGWGRNLFGVWLAGGPRRARYVSAEYTEVGRRVSEMVAALDRNLDFTALAFDYHSPDLSSLGTAARAVVFTCHSVEQIPALPELALQNVIGLAQEVRCVHFEPFGWQCSPEDRGGSSRQYAEKHDYNRNLYQLLRQLEQGGCLTIDRVALDVLGTNPDNATSILAWTSKARS